VLADAGSIPAASTNTTKKLTDFGGFFVVFNLWERISVRYARGVRREFEQNGCEPENYNVHAGSPDV